MVLFYNLLLSILVLWMLSLLNATRNSLIVFKVCFYLVSMIVLILDSISLCLFSSTSDSLVSSEELIFYSLLRI